MLGTCHSAPKHKPNSRQQTGPVGWTLAAHPTFHQLTYVHEGPSLPSTTQSLPDLGVPIELLPGRRSSGTARSEHTAGQTNMIRYLISSLQNEKGRGLTVNFACICKALISYSPTLHRVITHPRVREYLTCSEPGREGHIAGQLWLWVGVGTDWAAAEVRNRIQRSASLSQGCKLCSYQLYPSRKWASLSPIHHSEHWLPNLTQAMWPSPLTYYF